MVCIDWFRYNKDGKLLFLSVLIIARYGLYQSDMLSAFGIDSCLSVLIIARYGLYHRARTISYMERYRLSVLIIARYGLYQKRYWMI